MNLHLWILPELTPLHTRTECPPPPLPDMRSCQISHAGLDSGDSHFSLLIAAKNVGLTVVAPGERRGPCYYVLD